MKHWPVFLTAILFLAGASAARSKDSGKGCQNLSENVVSLISEYKELRERRRQFPEGTYDKDLRGYGGKLHRVLASLGTELGHPPYTKKIIVECVGEPDAIKDGRQMARFLDIYKRERKTGQDPKEKRARECLIYYWRGGHDFLFFINEGGLIVDHGWWFAYE